LVEQINYNLLFRWFVGLAIEDSVWNHSVFSKNRDRLIEHDVVIELFNKTVEMAQAKGLLSGEHFSVDGTQIKAWAGHKSVRRKDGSDDDRPPDDWRGERRSNDTHESKTDPDALLYRKSHAAPALPSFLGHVVTDNRHGLVVNVQATPANGTAERDAAATMLDELPVRGPRITVGADKAYDTRGFVQACRDIGATPHVTQNLARTGGSAIDGRTTRHAGYGISQRKRKCIEQCFGWAKVIGPIRQVMVRGLYKVDQALTLTMAAYNLTRLRNLAGVSV
ncbi:MAG: IS5 family transposase, partial [Aquabacterium sp.]